MAISGQIYIVNGNEPMLLNDPEKLWVVQSGAIALFVVTVKNGEVAGTRRYLGSVEKEGALFGTAPQTERQILAVPIGETKLLQVDQERFAQLIADADMRAIAWVENWVTQLGNIVAQVPMPKIHRVLVGKETITLTHGENCQPQAGMIRWVKLQQGTAHFLGMAELPVTTTTGIFPVCDCIWLESAAEAELVVYQTTDLGNADILLTGLSQLHTQVLNCIDLLDQQAAQTEILRLRDRQQHSHQTTDKALRELASTLNPQVQDFGFESTPLLTAAGAVGRVLGIKIRPPVNSQAYQRFVEPLEAIARASRIRIRRVTLTGKWWQKDSGPLVAYTQQENQPVALLPLSPHSYQLLDPVERCRVPVTRRIADTLAPIAYTIYRSLPNHALTAWELLQFAFKGRAKDLTVILGTGVGVTLIGMLTAYCTGMIIDNAIPDSNKILLVQIGFGLLIASLGTALFLLAQGLATLRIETAGDDATQAAVWDRLLNLPLSFFREYTIGDLQSRVSSISTIRRQLSGRTLINLISSLFALFYLGQLFYYNSKLALVAVAVTIVILIVTTVASLILLRKVPRLLELQGNILGQTVQLINGISKLHIAGAQERAFATWIQNYNRQIKLELSTQQVEDTVAIFNTVMPNITSGLIFWFTAGLMQPNPSSGEIALSLGTYLAFNAALSNFLKGTTDLSSTVTEVLPVIPQWKRTQPILATIPEVDATKSDPGQIRGEIVIERVNFRYRQAGLLTLNDVNISAQPGEFIAIVGPSGSGKSTIFRLLLGFESPTAGKIYYDGQDLARLDVDAVRRQLGVVLQNGQLISTSIFENIACGTPLTLDEAWEAARQAGLADDIAAMPMQMYTVISEGASNISAGQRQRLLIARALALKPKVLLFDEATSALDNKTQAIVSQNLEQLQVTRIAIAHRLSTIRKAHRIYVLQAGRIVQQGSFDELVTVEGLFTQLMARQMA
ncbi:NHLP bacteriocin export ABC transporter permease/ATPase subunit [Nostoc sp. FACHB-152]|uniref:NHLP bacteriocin export ABC transporter permease/ATPase subunit n=1 Tax=unclassified Nostoc TaxID=2593658 RepID=UPI001688A288|nr:MULTISPECIES: NHLP bacteriocin export ABC transporter permease/ATPase subunit [unclassified Nostoc]MBD2445594.1 NHLP bacteriocin export ABC transporter permease/ATPase subunit [Nostoc sp. FACHB-152]MBD2466706.1 NHLP bacteriocin export ABC transporter permease/ATPase subunit [Nostoc sp. FACHB-145]